MFLSYLVREITSCYDLFENQIFLYNESCPQSIQQESDREEDLEVGAILCCCIKGTLFKSSGTNATSHISFSLSFEIAPILQKKEHISPKNAASRGLLESSRTHPNITILGSQEHANRNVNRNAASRGLIFFGQIQHHSLSAFKTNNIIPALM